MIEVEAYRSRANVVVAKIREGEEFLDALKRLVSEHDVRLGMVVGIGGFKRVRIGLFRGDGYDEVVVEALPSHVLEVAGLMGNVVVGPDGNVYPHLHVVVARRQGEVYAGHLLEATVKPFIELFIVELVEDTIRARELFKHRWAK